MLSEKEKVTFVPASEPLSTEVAWRDYDDDLERFANSEDKYWDIVVPKGIDVKVLRSGLRSRVKTDKFKDRIKLVSKTISGKLKLQLQKV